MQGSPKTLRDAIIYFADEDNAHAFMVAIRWPEGPQCPHCGTFNVRLLSTRRVFRCKAKGCRKDFTAKRGTIFEDSPISLSKWFAAGWLLVNCKNGVSSYEVARDLGVCQKTAWFMLHRLRRAIKAKSFDKKLAGVVEADEAYIGGLFKNMHKSRRQQVRAESDAAGASTMRGAIGKTFVQAVLERGGEVRAQVLETLSLAPRLDFLKEHAEPGAALMTDEGYDSPQVDAAFAHEFVNHQIEYVRGNVHCNGVENFWSLLQRGLSGTYVSVEPYHLSAYVDEQAFRYNNRKTDDGERFVRAMTGAPGCRLTYRKLTGKEDVN
jgi:transposase-like protein